MKISIQRKTLVEYEIDIANITLLTALNFIKKYKDQTLSFSSGCRSSACGSCAVRVNEKEVLACSYIVQDGDVIEPLKNTPVLRDLIVDMDKALSFNAASKAYSTLQGDPKALTPENEKINELQSDCILCGACYSACPVYVVNENFFGPFALTRVWKYVSDAREEDTKEKIDIIQNNGVWDCTLCNECTMVCPQEISSKSDIEKLRARSAMQGYSDPSFSGGFADFGSGFGFDGSPSF